MKEEIKPDPNYAYTFEYEYVNGNFNLYERGGDRYLCGHGQCKGPQPYSSLKNKGLNLLYPVVILKFSKTNVEKDLETAIEKMVEVESWRVPERFHFIAKKLGGGTRPFSGVACVKYDGRKGKLESISFHE